MSHIVLADPYLCRLSVVLAMAMLAHGCMDHSRDREAASHHAADQRTADVPSGAIPVGEELYQVRIGADDDGCPMFRLYSPTKLVAQVIYYRDAAGGFTIRKQDAACASGVSE